MNNILSVVLGLDTTQVANAALWVQVLIIACILLAVLVVRPKDR